MSDIPTYPILIFPATVEEYLKSPKQNRKKKPRAFLLAESPAVYQAPKQRNILVISWLKWVKQVSKYFFWGTWGVLLALLCQSMVLTQEVVIGEDRLFYLISTLIFGVISGLIWLWCDRLLKIAHGDQKISDEIYWQELATVNQWSFKKHKSNIRKKIVQGNRNQRKKLITEGKLTVSPLNKSSSLPFPYQLERGILRSAQPGVSEVFLEKHLQKYFPTCEIVEEFYPIPGTEIGYTTDFSIIAPEGIGIDLEIDEPYEGKKKQPHHCRDQNKDYKRNLFLLEKGLIILRISEYQAVSQPEEVCRTVGQILTKVTGNSSYLQPLKQIQRLTPDKTWTTDMAKAMARDHYRELYLDEYGIFKQR